jgi:hypothetical protein
MAEEPKQPATRGAHHPSDVATPGAEERVEKQPYATEHEDYSGEHHARPDQKKRSGPDEAAR